MKNLIINLVYPLPHYTATIADADNSDTNNIYYLLFLGTAIVTLFALVVIVFVLFYHNRLAKIKKNEATLLLHTAISSEIAERKRIAADLHDGLAGDLGGIRNYVSILIESETDPSKELLYANIKTLIDEAFETTREVSYKLMPPLLENQGFVAAVRNLTQRLSRSSKVIFTTTVIDETLNLPPIAGYELLRVIQELTTNIIKYGNAQRCAIEIKSESTKTIITVTDDGISFNFNEKKTATMGLGLKNIESRLKSINAGLVQEPVSEGNRLVISYNTLAS